MVQKYFHLFFLSLSMSLAYAAGPPPAQIARQRPSQTFFQNYIARWNLPHKVVGLAGLFGGAAGAWKLGKKAHMHRKELKKVNAALVQNPTDKQLLKKKAFHKKWAMLNVLFASIAAGGAGLSGWLLGDAVYSDWLFTDGMDRFNKKIRVTPHSNNSPAFLPRLTQEWRGRDSFGNLIHPTGYGDPKPSALDRFVDYLKALNPIRPNNTASEDDEYRVPSMVFEFRGEDSRGNCVINTVKSYMWTHSNSNPRDYLETDSDLAESDWKKVPGNDNLWVTDSKD